MRKTTHITSVNLPPELHRKLKERAKKERRSVSNYLVLLAEKELTKPQPT